MFTPQQSLNRIQARMTERAMSLTELAARTGVERAVYKRAVTAVEFLPVDVLAKVAEVLEVTVAWLVGEASHPGQEIAYRIYLTPRPVEYQEIGVERRETGDVFLKVLMDDRVAEFEFRPETAARLSTELSAALGRSAVPPPVASSPPAPPADEDTFVFSGSATDLEVSMDYPLVTRETG